MKESPVNVASILEGAGIGALALYKMRRILAFDPANSLTYKSMPKENIFK